MMRNPFRDAGKYADHVRDYYEAMLLHYARAGDDVAELRYQDLAGSTFIVNPPEYRYIELVAIAALLRRRLALTEKVKTEIALL